MNTEKYVMGPLATNTYFICEKDEVVIVDPAGKTEKVIELLKGRKPLAILLTHGHFDHTKTVDGLYKTYGCPVYLHEADMELVKNPNALKESRVFAYLAAPIHKLKEGMMKISSFEFEVLFTPGHSEGSVIYNFGKTVFTGDTLFKGSVGRSDLVGGNNSKLVSSLKVFFSLDEEAIICPGHEENSKLSTELLENPFFR